jgi:hypothetical protein
MSLHFLVFWHLFHSKASTTGLVDGSPLKNQALYVPTGKAFGLLSGVSLDKTQRTALSWELKADSINA